MGNLTTYEGVKVPADAFIPEKTRVYVVVRGTETSAHIASPRLVHPEQARDFELQVIENPTDADV